MPIWDVIEDFFRVVFLVTVVTAFLGITEELVTLGRSVQGAVVCPGFVEAISNSVGGFIIAVVKIVHEIIIIITIIGSLMFVLGILAALTFIAVIEVIISKD